MNLHRQPSNESKDKERSPNTDSKRNHYIIHSIKFEWHSHAQLTQWISPWARLIRSVESHFLARTVRPKGVPQPYDSTRRSRHPKGRERAKMVLVLLPKQKDNALLLLILKYILQLLLQPFDRHRLDQVPIHAGQDRLQHMVLVIIRSDHEHLDAFGVFVRPDGLG